MSPKGKVVNKVHKFIGKIQSKTTVTKITHEATRLATELFDLKSHSQLFSQKYSKSLLSTVKAMIGQNSKQQINIQ